MKAWFYNLPKRDRNMLLIGAVAIMLYVFIEVIFFGIYDAREKASQRLDSTRYTVGWIKTNVAELTKNGSVSGNAAVGSNGSLAQISEMAAKKADIRLTRFQPKSDQEAQVWVDNIDFSRFLTFTSSLELDYGVNIETLTVNTANGETGFINARVKFKK